MKKEEIEQRVKQYMDRFGVCDTRLNILVEKPNIEMRASQLAVRVAAELLKEKDEKRLEEIKIADDFADDLIKKLEERDEENTRLKEGLREILDVLFMFKNTELHEELESLLSQQQTEPKQ